MLAPARHDCLAPRADLRRCLRGAGAAFTKLTWLGSILPATCRADRERESRNPAGQHAHTIVRAGTGSIGPTNQSNLQLRTQRGHPSAELESVAFFGIPCKVSARQRREREREREREIRDREIRDREIERSRDREIERQRGRRREREGGGERQNKWIDSQMQDLAYPGCQFNIESNGASRTTHVFEILARIERPPQISGQGHGSL